MTILNPFLLLGTLAVLLPVALHFLFKAWYKPLPWAAMEFLRKSIEQTAKRIKFRELILLLLRCAALLLLAVALARLVFGFGWGGVQGEGVDAVLVLDTSYSMGARDGGKTRFERAQEAALSVIDNLPAGSTVQVVTCSDRATYLPFTPTNLDQARSTVRGLTLTSQAGDVSPGLAEAYQALDRVPGGNRAEVYLFTDLQRNGLEGTAGAKATDLKGRGTVVVVRCGSPPVGAQQPKVKNVTVTDITFPDAIPHSGTRLPFTVLLKNTGHETVTNVAVSLTVDGSDNGIDSGLATEIEPGATYPVTMTAALGEPGTRLLTARVGEPNVEVGGKVTATTTQPDDLPGDNRFDKLILVRQTIGVLVVDGRPGVRSDESAAHFVANAVTPVAEGQEQGYFIKAKVLPPDTAAQQLRNPDAKELLKEYQVVILADVPADADDKPGIAALTPEFVANLSRFVTAGGGLIVGGGPFVVPASYNRVLGSGGAKLLPFDLTGRVDATPEAPLKPALDTVQSPSMLARLKTYPFDVATAKADVLTALAAAEDPASLGRVLVRLSDQTPLVSAKPVGSGEVVFIHTSLDETWTNWPGTAAGTSYVATIRFLLSHLTGRAGKGGNLTAGEAITWTPPDANTEYDLAKPDGKRVRVGKAVGEGKPTLTTTDTAVAGDYRLQPVGFQTDDAPRFAVNPDLRESDSLDVLGDDQVEGKLGFRPVLTVAGKEAETAGQFRSTSELTIALLLLLFVLACGESAWAWYCGRSA